MTTKSLRSEPQKRLDSLDALRGFDMFWITGGNFMIVWLLLQYMYKKKIFLRV